MSEKPEEPIMRGNKVSEWPKVMGVRLEPAPNAPRYSDLLCPRCGVAGEPGFSDPFGMFGRARSFELHWEPRIEALEVRCWRCRYEWGVASLAPEPAQVKAEQRYWAETVAKLKGPHWWWAAFWIATLVNMANLAVVIVRWSR